jgi:hypothetical protein
MVNDDKSLNSMTIDYYSQGKLTKADEGDYTITIRNANDESLVTMNFSASSNLLFANSNSVNEVIKETDTSIFSFPLRYPLGSRKIELGYAGESIVRLNIPTKLLLDAINRLPKSGFRQPSRGQKNIAENRRETLKNKVDAVDNMLEADNEKGAQKKLRHDVKRAVNRWLKDEYPAPTVDDTSKSELLTLIKNHIKRLE